MSDLQSRVETAIRETLKDPEGAGSDLQVADDGPGDEWMYVEGNLDVRHLASLIIEVIRLEQ